MFFQGNEKYNCATYLRLSRSDGDQQESNSIKNQRALLNDYMGKHPELHKFDEYVDDGYSGTNFERPDFKRMMQDIEKRNVNCIIVKDLSRFGRNYIERKAEKVCCAEHQKMKAVKSIRLTRGIDASLEKPLSSKARKSFERFFQLWKKKKCKLCILIGCWTRILRKSNSAWMLDYCSTEKKQMRSLRT